MLILCGVVSAGAACGGNVAAAMSVDSKSPGVLPVPAEGEEEDAERLAAACVKADTLIAQQRKRAKEQPEQERSAHAATPADEEECFSAAAEHKRRRRTGSGRTELGS